ncbi:MAG: hypothetical protein LBK53_08495 [Heliobacteriaceae bacterium]|jgi:hypothetical protein|nr:hypothetical protein [Heliobacteriaceae bacterium]
MNNYEENRKLTASLIRQVLTGGISAREAVLRFPKDSADKSIEAAYHALVHFEADEDLRRRDPLYKEEQDDYVEFISHLLEKGEDLPDNIINIYEEYYESANIPHENNSKGFWKSFMKFLNI